MFLATTALSEFWDPGQEILLLGSWCLPYERRKEWSRRRVQTLPSPWNDRGRFYEAAAAVEEHQGRLLSHLGDYLNGVQGTSFSPRYWRILLGPWLLHFLHPLYDRYIHLTDALRRHPGLQTILLDLDSYQTPADVRELVDWVCGDLYNLQLFSQLLRELGFSFPGRRYLKSVPGTGTVPGTELRPLRRLAKQGALWAEAAARRLQGKMWQIALCDIACSSPMAWALAWKTRLHALPLTLEGTPLSGNSRPLFNQRRAGLAELPAAGEFEQLLIRCLPQNFPSLYLEGFHEAREEALRRTPRIPPVVLSGNGWYFNEPFKFLAAEAAAKGRRLVTVQHGGGYGTFRYSALEKHEEAVGDSWRVWGWAGRNDGHRRNLPSPQISSEAAEQARPATRRGKGILFVTTSQPRYLYRFHSAPVGSQWEAYFEWELRFLRALSPEIRRQLLFRPYPKDYGQGVRRRISERFQLRWDRGRPFDRRLKECRLVVVDHVATTFLDALGSNTPTILFWDPQRWEVRTEAEPSLESLRKAGILFSSPEAAAEGVRQVWGELESWWTSPAVQEVRNRFVDRYALARKDWLDSWSRALEEEILLAQSRPDNAGQVERVEEPVPHAI